MDDNELAQYAEYLRHETGQIPNDLIDHVASCGYCRAELMAITDMLDTLPDMLPDVSQAPASPVTGHRLPVADGKRTARIKWLRAVASVAAIVLLAWVIQRLLPDRLMIETVATNKQKDSTLTSNPLTSNPLISNLLTSDSSSKSATLPDTVRYAEAFEPNSAYESLVGAKYRSGRDPKVEGPDPGTVFCPGDTLKISWTADARDEYVLTVLDNKANPVKEIKPGGEGFLIWRIDLKPGLYYWKFLGKDEMWKMGRFMVKAQGSRMSE